MIMWKRLQNQYISFTLIFFVLFFWPVICSAEFTIDDEKKLGKEFYDKLAKHHLLSENKRLNEYITEIGNLILKGNKQVPFDFRFSVVDSSAINAFATPGGYIYINKGLINAAENEGELAGVIAHEIGHANARHIASIIKKSQKIGIATLAAILAGAFLSGGGEATAAIASFSMAGAASLNLKYSREHEEEADRLGMEYLVGAGYYPSAMVDFLKIVKRYEFISKSMPSYLLTHPGTDERIFYLESLTLTQYHQKGSRSIIGNLNRIKTLFILDEDNLNIRHKQLEEALAKDNENVDLLYALALIEDKQGKINEAVNHYQKALTLSPRDEDILKSLGLMYLKMGKADLAHSYLLPASIINPDNDDIILALGKTYETMGKYNNALECFLKLGNKNPDDVDIYYYIAMAYGKLNILGDSHYNFGLYFKKQNKKDTALFHFKKALDYFPHGSAKADAVDQAIKSLKK
ncbi:MAG: TPR repeat-containing protein YfgC precursor [Smithella sp. PtaU1.Bin162]|nr:MAG: TPR repeat-containing protein YfgC precursor [Smithella sp. PtaU1.Bin162]